MKKWTFLFVGLFFVSMLFSQSLIVKSLDELENAFARDNYEIIKTVSFQGKRGILAQHKTACNYETKDKKKVLYLEGNAYQMGYMTGLLAEKDVQKMTTLFLDKVIFAFIGWDVDPDKIKILWQILKAIIVELTKKSLPDIPQEYLQEMKGIVDGCKAANQNTKVTYDDLCMLNVGIDCLLSYIYAINNLWEGRKFSAEESDLLKPENLRIPVMCNAFSVFGRAVSDGKHYFGRDFMFPTADVFEYTACKIIYCPDDGRIPLVSMTAPGFVGSIASMNKEGIGIGVDMSPSGNCNHKRPGLNSLILVRHSAHRGASAQDALDKMIQTQRGVSWDYIIADGKNNRSVVVEAGHTTDNLNFLQYPPDNLQKANLLPDQGFLNYYENQTHQKGIMVRWNDYQYPEIFLSFNKKLFQFFNKPYNPADFSERGYINKKHTDQNCPAAYYFAPQRENKDDVLVMINHYVVPSMRLCAMNPATVVVSKGNLNDIQWRYDELNNQILENYGKIDFEKARQLIDFLAPYNQFPDYYQHNKPSSDGKTKVLRGSVSVCNLTDKIMQSHFGFYEDEWVTIQLMNYVE